MVAGNAVKLAAIWVGLNDTVQHTTSVKCEQIIKLKETKPARFCFIQDTYIQFRQGLD